MKILSDISLEIGDRPALSLKKIFGQRLKRDPAYSLGAFARELGVSKTLLSLLFSGKRELSCQQAIRLASRLGMSAEEKKKWFQSVLASVGAQARGRRRLEMMIEFDYENATSMDSPSQVYESDSEVFDHLREWYYLAIMNATQLRDFKSDPKWIADRIGISEDEANAAIRTLLKYGLLKLAGGKRLTKTHLHRRFQTQRTLSSVRRFHRQMTERALECLKQTDDLSFRRRKIVGSTLTVRSDRLEEVFKRIERFQVEMADLLSQGLSDDLYHLNIQFFPLTKPKETHS